MSCIHKSLKTHILSDDDAIVVDLKNSLGSWLVDENGRQYLDCFSQFASQPLGWNHPKILAQKDRLTNAAIHKIANSDMYCEDYEKFVDTFARFSPDFKHHFFVSGGALGVENALKVAFDWKCQKSGCGEQMDVIHLTGAFHGRTGYTLSLTNNPTTDHKVKYFPKFKWTRITTPKMYFPINVENVSRMERLALDQAEDALTKDKRMPVAAILVEAIQGEGGDNHFRPEFLQGLRKLADAHEALLIFDEVQTGVGLTGKMWAYEHFDIVPDLISFGKKMQVSGCSSTGRVDEVVDNVFAVPSRINSTWGGNIVDMARSTMYLEIIKEDNLIENARVVGDYFLEKLKNLGVENARGRGLMLAFDLSDGDERDRVLQRLNEKMIALSCGSKTIRFRPHLTFTKDDTDVAIGMVQDSL